MLKKIVTLSFVLLLLVQVTYAASIQIESPSQTPSTGENIVVYVLLNPEEQSISGIAGNFSFPSDLFSLVSISNNQSVVSLWIEEPKVSEEKYLDNRTHISFEGIFPGGFDGVRSPYYNGKKSGIVFSVTLSPKAQGSGSLIVDDITLNAFTKDATPLPVASAINYITIPNRTTIKPTQATAQAVSVVRQTLSAIITRDALVNNNAWYIMVHDSDEKSSIKQLYVAETDDYNGELVSDISWRVAKNPYVLLYQDRNKFVHSKVVYSDNTYTIKTLPPVENSHQIVQSSRILVSILIVLFCLLYIYGKTHLTLSKKQ